MVILKMMQESYCYVASPISRYDLTWIKWKLAKAFKRKLYTIEFYLQQAQDQLD